MTHAEQIESLLRRVAELETETAEQRQERERRLAEQGEQLRTVAMGISNRETRIRNVERKLAELKPWRDKLLAEREKVQSDLTAARRELPNVKESPSRSDALRERIEMLEDTLLVIDGAKSWQTAGCDIFERLQGFPPKPGCRHAMQDRLMLGRTIPMVDALEKELEVLRAEIADLESQRAQLTTGSS